MKIRTRILTAVLATATAFSCALTASASTTAPTLNLQGNESAPATLENGAATATLTLKSSDFDQVKGAKIKVTLPAGITFKSGTVEITGTNNWVENKNFAVTENGQTITLVDVFNMDGTVSADLKLTFKFDVEATAMGSYNVTVSGNFADLEEGTKDTEKTANLVIGRESSKITLNENNVTAESGYFIPAYGAYTGTYKNPSYLTKDGSGNILPGDKNGEEATVLKCKLPTGDKKVTSFGYSEKEANPSGVNEYERSNGIQFGAYAIDNSLTYGTFVFRGDYEAFKESYGKTDEEILSLVAARYDKRVSEGKIEEGKGLSIPYKDSSEKIVVMRAKRTTYLWKGADTNKDLQYAVRLYQLLDDATYTSVAYSKADNVYNFSTEIQTVKNPFTGNQEG